MTPATVRNAKTTVINFSDSSSGDWNFIEKSLERDDFDWRLFRSVPSNFLERRITKPKLSRYRAALQAASSAGKTNRSVLISHLPRATLSLAVFQRLLRVRAPHLAFAFNFTDLPQGAERRAFSFGLTPVSRFTVYSTFEKEKYAGWFDLDPSRIDFIHWAMARPVPAEPQPALRIPGPYIFAGGGEGRDYRTLVEAMRQLPDIRLVIAARPRNLEGLRLPDNVTAHSNLAHGDFWRLLDDSRFMALPLRDAETACGHITLVGAYHLGKPIVATDSRGIHDYAATGAAALCPPHDAAAMAGEIRRLFDDDVTRSAMAVRAADFANMHCTLERWVPYLARTLDNLSAR